MTLEERLNETINQMEERIAELEEERDHLRHFVPWTDHVILKEDIPLGLPVPRLEIVWDHEEGSMEWTARYRLVYGHLLDDIVLVPLGQTKVSGRMREPVDADGTIDLPFRDGAHLHHDCEHLNLRAFVRYGSHVCEIEAGVTPISMRPWKAPTT